MVERVEYSVATRSGSLEFRDYPAIALATVRGMSDNEAFGLLFDYISGDNDSSSRIAMTAPVLSGAVPSEGLPMTAPVVSSVGSLSFVMPSGRKASTLPSPRDKRISITDVSKRAVAVLRFRGRASPEQVATKEAELLDLLRQSRIRTVGSPFLMRYNPPFIPGFLRRNEVGVEVALID
ncbi:MAG: heme-binding protein [Methanobacteriota archaeon]|nr:MAG: heme-binding protein [Euryarchaeota archaeon]